MNMRMNRRRALIIATFGVIIIFLLILGLQGIEPNGVTPNGGGPVEGYLRIDKETHCSTDADDARFSKNPPYFVGEKYYWWLQIRVYADGNVTDVMVYDQLGDEFMIEGISFTPIEKPGPYDYVFSYDSYEFDGEVSVTDGVTVWTGFLNETGVVFSAGARTHGFGVYWTGESLEAHIEWSVGEMKSGDRAEIYVTVSTDTNLDGQQEFAMPGTYLLNSGANVEAIVESSGEKTVATSNVIEIAALERID